MSWLLVRTFALSSLTLAISATFSPASAEDEFNLRILELDSPLENTDTLKNFLKNHDLLPGKYLTSVMWGREFVEKREIVFVLSGDKKQLIPQFTKADLRELGVKVDAVPALNLMQDSDPVGDIAQVIDGAQYDFQLDSQTLSLRIAQIYHDVLAADDIPPQRWDDGMPAAWASYYVSGSQQHLDGEDQNAHWLNLNSGINFGAWRLSNNSTYSDNAWASISTSLQRDIKTLRSQFEVGQTYTNGELFDSVQMVGVKLETDTSMLPSSQQGFAPVVRGIANSDAQVIIKQNGYTIYQSWVPPGPFEIKNLSQVTAGTDLEVTVKEADGREHSFIQASSSVPVLQREGALKYSLAAGKYRDNEDGEEPGFGQATAIYGLPHGVTVYGGLLGAPIYRSGLLGMGADLGRWGSMSVDLTAARTAFDDGRDDANGLSWRAQYAKDFPATNTMVTLASYRYSSSGFYTFQEALDQRDKPDDNGLYSYRQTNNRRSRLQLNLSQAVGSWGAIYLNGYQQDYWDMAGNERSVSLGYSSNWRDITWSVNYSLTKTPYSNNDQQVSLSVNIPLSRWLSNSWATYHVNSAKNGNTSHQVGIGGTALEDNNLSYNLQQTYTDHNVGYGASLSGRYRNSVGDFGLGYSYAGDNKQWNYSAQGSVVAHPHGITLGQSVQSAFAVVHIENGAGVKVQNAAGVYTDYWGNAIVPALTHYRYNGITVNTQGRDDVDIQEATQDVVPTKNAIVAANYDARSGTRALLTLRHGKESVPFGALLTMGDSVAIVGDDSEVYVSGIQETMTFTVQWGSEANQKCAGSVTAPGHSTGIYTATVDCR